VPNPLALLKMKESASKQVEQGLGSCMPGVGLSGGCGTVRASQVGRVFGDRSQICLAQPYAQADRQMAARLSCFINFGGAICRPLSYYVGLLYKLC
jgi:hypothetical protein